MSRAFASSESYKRENENYEGNNEIIGAKNDPNGAFTFNHIFVMLSDEREINSDAHHSEKIDNQHHDNALKNGIFFDNPRN